MDARFRVCESIGVIERLAGRITRRSSLLKMVSNRATNSLSFQLSRCLAIWSPENVKLVTDFSCTPQEEISPTYLRRIYKLEKSKEIETKHQKFLSW